MDHCTCPLGLRAMVDCRGLKCRDCGKPITDDTYGAAAVPGDLRGAPRADQDEPAP